jgi:uncharacterized membrane protein YphA (DoxX/SURF4 family)
VIHLHSNTNTQSNFHISSLSLSCGTSANLGQQRGLALLLLRVFVVIAFVFHGYGKVADIASFAAEFGIPYLLAAAAAYAQLGAGLLLIPGLVTPMSSLALAGTMAVATSQLIARGEPFVSPHGHSWEASSLYLVLNVALICLAPVCTPLTGCFSDESCWSPLTLSEVRQPAL